MARSNRLFAQRQSAVSVIEQSSLIAANREKQTRRWMSEYLFLFVPSGRQPGSQAVDSRLEDLIRLKSICHLSFQLVCELFSKVLLFSSHRFQWLMFAFADVALNHRLPRTRLCRLNELARREKSNVLTILVHKQIMSNPLYHHRRSTNDRDND